MTKEDYTFRHTTKQLLPLYPDKVLSSSFKTNNMKTIIMAIAVLLTATTATFAQTKKTTTQKHKTTTAKQYTCPMHPDVVKTKPGKCPECGMALVAKAAPAVKYTCTMDPDVVTNKPGKCPKCGMTLTRMKSEKMMTDSAGEKM
jgi:uncharacterized protein with PIN domain